MHVTDFSFVGMKRLKVHISVSTYIFSPNFFLSMVPITASAITPIQGEKYNFKNFPLPINFTSPVPLLQYKIYLKQLGWGSSGTSDFAKVHSVSIFWAEKASIKGLDWAEKCCPAPLLT